MPYTFSINNIYMYIEPATLLTFCDTILVYMNSMLIVVEFEHKPFNLHMII